jgi:ATP-binding cassette subfamily C protein
MTAVHSDMRQALVSTRSHYTAAGAFSLGINILYLTTPLYMLQVYDRVLASGSVPTLVMLTIACLIALLTLGALDVLRARVLIRSGIRLNNAFYARVMAAMAERANSTHSLDRGQALRDLDTFRQFITGSGVHALFDAPWAPIYIAVIFMLHPMLGVLALVCAVLLLALAIANEYATRAPLAVANEAAVRSYATIDVALRNAEVIRAMGMLQPLLRRWAVDRDRVLKLHTVASDRSAYIVAVTRFLRLFMQSLMLGAGAYLAVEHAITPGAMFVSTLLLSRALQPVEQALGIWRPLLGARTALARVARLLVDTPVTAKTLPLPRPKGELTLDNVMFAPSGVKRPILNGVTFKLEPGEALAVVGATAAGKSTLLRLIVGTLAPTTGNVRLDGASVYLWERTEFGRHVGYLPQDIELFAGTVAENIARFSQPAPDAIVEAAINADAHDMIVRLPQGYETEVGEAGSSLSGGQRQRIALARAIFGLPSLLVLDEPNSNLDADGEIALGNCLKKLKANGTTIVMVSHRLSAVGMVDKILLLKNGVMDAFGPRRDVLAKLQKAARMRSINVAPQERPQES